MLKELQVISVFLISVIVSNCRGVLKTNQIGRITASVFTPYDKCGNVDVDVVPQLAEYFAKRNVKNVQILGFYGQGPIIDLESRKALTSAWVKETNRLGLTLTVEIGVLPFPDQLELAKFCSQLNVSVISAFPLLVYEAKNTKQLVEDYQRLSEAAPSIPLLYRALTVTGAQISAAEAVVTLMGRVKTFIGGVISIDDALNIEAAVPSIAGYQLWIYGNRNIAPALTVNLNVSVTNFVNLCPKLVLDIEDAVDCGYIDKALYLQQKLNRLIQAIVSNNEEIIDFNSRSYIKYIRATFRIFTGIDLGERVPFDKVNSTEIDRIRSNLEEFQDFINCYCK